MFNQKKKKKEEEEEEEILYILMELMWGKVNSLTFFIWRQKRCFFFPKDRTEKDIFTTLSK